MSKVGCHVGNPVVFEAKGIKVHAGGTNRSGGWHVMSPMPDVAIGPIGVMKSAKTRDIMPLGWSCSDKVSIGQTPVLFEIDWPDYNIPNNLGREWWLAFVDDCISKGIKSISTQCMGGHGRTGVQLCILAHMLEATTQPDAGSLIRWVRERYCEHAVEAKCQQDYIAEMLQIPVGESAIAVQSHNPWAGQNFNDDLAFTQAELTAQKKHETKKKAEKKAPRWKKKYESPIRNGWSLVAGGDGEEDFFEWRRTRTEDMEAPCRHSGTAVKQADISLMEGTKLVTCEVTERQWHPIEMATKSKSNAAMAKELEMKVKDIDDGGTSILINRTWHPTWFVKYHKGEFISWLKYYDDVLHKSDKKADKLPSFKKKDNQRTLTDFTDDGDVFDLDGQYIDFRDEEDWSFDPDEEYEIDGVSLRETNDEIESEDVL